MNKDLLTLRSYSREEILSIIELAKELKAERKKGVLRDDFAGKTAVLIFDKPSLRTKITFETAIYELGGNALSMANANGKLGERESVADMAHNLERWVHMLVVRTFDQKALEDLAAYSDVPVINALTDDYHPCQSFALGLTLEEYFGGKEVTVAYLGDGNNVCVSHMMYCAKRGHSFVVATPEGYEPPADIVAEAQEEATKYGATIVVTNNPQEAVSQADLVYTDVWASMGQEDEADERHALFLPYQVNAGLMEAAPKDALFSHCLPAHRGDEVTDEVLDGDRSIIFDEAENRLHAHKAIMVHLLNSQKAE